MMVCRKPSRPQWASALHPSPHCYFCSAHRAWALLAVAALQSTSPLVSVSTPAVLQSRTSEMRGRSQPGELTHSFRDVQFVNIWLTFSKRKEFFFVKKWLFLFSFSFSPKIAGIREKSCGFFSFFFLRIALCLTWFPQGTCLINHKPLVRVPPRNPFLCSTHSWGHGRDGGWAGGATAAP